MYGPRCAAWWVSLMRLCWLCRQVDGVPFMDAGIVNWNRRDKKVQGGPMTFMREEVSPAHAAMECMVIGTDGLCDCVTGA